MFCGVDTDQNMIQQLGETGFSVSCLKGELRLEKRNMV